MVEKFFAPAGWNLDLDDRSKLTFVIVLLESNSGRVPCKLTIRAQDSLYHLQTLFGR